MTERDALLRAVLENPDDDLPRLVFADFLDEQARSPRPCEECDGTGRRFGVKRHEPPNCPHCDAGTVRDTNAARAELIRVGCELGPHVTRPRGGRSNVPTHRCTVCSALWTLWADGHGGWSLASADCGECCDNVAMGRQIEQLSAEAIALFHRERAILSVHARTWFGDIVPGASVSNWSPHDPVPYFVLTGGREFVNIEIHRGFVAALSLPLAAFLGHAGAVFRSHPVTRVVITDAVIHPSGGNDTYYLGGLGQFPSEYWGRLGELPTRTAVRDALHAACLDHGRTLAGLPPLTATRPAAPAARPGPG